MIHIEVQHTAFVMMNCFCGMVDWQKVFSLVSSQDHCQGSSPLQISDTLWAGYEPMYPSE